jgi:hypothetical protein
MANPEKLVPYSTQGETFYLSACTKQEKWAVMNMCATGIDVAPVSIVFYYILEVLRQCDSLFWNISTLIIISDSKHSYINPHLICNMYCVQTCYLHGYNWHTAHVNKQSTNQLLHLVLMLPQFLLCSIIFWKCFDSVVVCFSFLLCILS